MNQIRKYSVLIVVACFIVLCIRLARAYDSEYAELKDNYKSGLSVNLDSEVKAENIKQVLLKRGYFTDEKDADFISRSIADSIKTGRRLESLYDFRKNSWKMLADTLAEYGGKILTGRIEQAKDIIGVNYDVTGTERSEVDLDSGSGRITVRVIDDDMAVPDVLVSLRHHYYDTTFNPCDTIYAVAKTSSTGEAIFKGLDTALSYSVLPFRDGYEYGHSNGTTGGTLGSTARVETGLNGEKALQTMYLK